MSGVVRGYKEPNSGSRGCTQVLVTTESSLQLHGCHLILWLCSICWPFMDRVFTKASGKQVSAMSLFLIFPMLPLVMLSMTFASLLPGCRRVPTFSWYHVVYTLLWTEFWVFHAVSCLNVSSENGDCCAAWAAFELKVLLPHPAELQGSAVTSA